MPSSVWAYTVTLQDCTTTTPGSSCPDVNVTIQQGALPTVGDRVEFDNDTIYRDERNSSAQTVCSELPHAACSLDIEQPMIDVYQYVALTTDIDTEITVHIVINLKGSDISMTFQELVFSFSTL